MSGKASAAVAARLLRQMLDLKIRTDKVATVKKILAVRKVELKASEDLVGDDMLIGLNPMDFNYFEEEERFHCQISKVVKMVEERGSKHLNTENLMNTASTLLVVAALPEIGGHLVGEVMMWMAGEAFGEKGLKNFLGEHDVEEIVTKKKIIEKICAINSLLGITDGKVPGVTPSDDENPNDDESEA